MEEDKEGKVEERVEERVEEKGVEGKVSRKKKVRKVIVVSIGVLLLGVVVLKIYKEEQERRAYEEEKQKYLSKYTEEQVEYIKKEGLIDRLMIGDKSLEKYIRERYTEVENGEEGLLRDEYEIGDYFKEKKKEGVVATVVPEYIKEVYNTDIEVIGTKLKGDKVEVVVKDDKYGVEGVVEYEEGKQKGEDTYGTKLTSKILSEKIEERLKGKLPEGTKVMAWGNSAVTLREKESVNTLRSDTVEDLIKRIEKVGNPLNSINVYVPVSEQFELKYVKEGIKEVLKYGEKEGGKKTKINLFFIKGKENIDKVVESLHNKRDVYKDESVEIPEWCGSGGKFVEGTKGELKVDLEEWVYGYIRIDDISKFEKSFNYETRENIVKEEIVEERGYLSRWYADEVPNVEVVVEVEMEEELIDVLEAGVKEEGLKEEVKEEVKEEGVEKEVVKEVKEVKEEGEE